MKLFVLILTITLVGTALAVKTYHIFDEKKNWIKALDACLSQGMTLATVTSQDESDQLMQQIKNSKLDDSFWIGGTRRGTPTSEEYFYWVGKNENATYGNWYKGEPNNPSTEQCINLKIDYGYLWNDSACSNEFYYVCEELESLINGCGSTNVGNVVDGSLAALLGSLGGGSQEDFIKSLTSRLENSLSGLEGFGGLDLSITANNQQSQGYQYGSVESSYPFPCLVNQVSN